MKDLPNTLISIHKSNMKRILSVLILISLQLVSTFAQVLHQDSTTVVTRPDSIMLNEVTIKGYRPSYKMTPEGLSTRIEGTVLSKLGNVNDVLSTIPSIVKERGRIEVFGKGVPLIYINGRKIYDMTELDQIKSEDIKDIELITSPGAKYASTVKAVIKIRTIRKRKGGLGFDVRSSYYQSENSDIVEQLNWNYQHKKIDVFGSLYYKMENQCWNTSTYQTLYADTLWSLHFEQRSRTKAQHFKMMNGVNYAFNGSHSIGFHYTLTLRPHTINNNTIKSNILADKQEYDDINNQIHDNESYNPAHLLNIYYKGKIKDTEIDFNGDYLFNKSEDRVNRMENSLYQDSRYVSSDNLTRNELFAARLLFGHPLLKGKLTIGCEYTYTLRDNQYVSYNNFIPSSANRIKEQHATPFIAYSKDVYIGDLTVGLRYEYVKYDYFDDDAHQNNQNHTFHNIFPHASLTSRLGKLRLNLSYSAKTLRPNYQQLSGNISYANRYNLQSGNPLLKYEKIHDISLTGTWKFLQFSFGYNNRIDAIIYWARQYGSHSELTSYINFPSLKNLNASISLSPTLSRWSPILDIAIRKQIMSVQTDNGNFHMGQPVWQFKLDNTFDMGKGWMSSINMWMRTKGNWENYYWSRNILSIDFSLSKSLLKDKLKIQFQAFDLLRMKKGAILHSDFIESTQISWTDNREIALTIRYIFNLHNNRYKGTGAGNEEKGRL